MEIEGLWESFFLEVVLSVGVEKHNNMRVLNDLYEELIEKLDYERKKVLESENKYYEELCCLLSAVYNICVGKDYESELLIQNAIKVSSNRYIFNFLLGEIYLIRNDRVRALLVYEQVLDAMSHEKGREGLLCDIMLMVANLYFTQGDEYIYACLNKANHVLSLYKDNEVLINRKNTIRILNNCCYYNLIAYESRCKNSSMNEKDDVYFFSASSCYDELIELVEDNDVDISSNVIDTMAWYNYIKYRRTRRIEVLSVAKKYALCLIAQKYINNSRDPLFSNDLHVLHAKDILKEVSASSLLD